MNKDWLKIIFLILCFGILQSTVFGQVGIESKKRSDRLLTKLTEADSTLTLLFVRRSFLSEENRLKTWLDQHDKSTRNYGYMKRKYVDVKSVQKVHQDYYDSLSLEIDNIMHFKNVGFIIDTQYSELIDAKKLKYTSSTGEIKQVVSAGNLVYLKYGLHPESHKRGLYFYSYDGIYLGASPFPSYIPSHRAFNAVIDAIFGSDPELLKANKLVTKINNKIEKAIVTYNAG